MPDSGTIRNDTDGTPYLSDLPNDKTVHIAYQNLSMSDLGWKYTVAFATEEKHMVSGINNMFATRYQWVDLVNKTVEFFSPDAMHPFTKLRFEKIGIYYTASVIVDSTQRTQLEKASGDIYTELAANIESNSMFYYGKKSDSTDLKLLKFTRLSYTTHPLSSGATRISDFTLLLVGGNKLVTTKLNTYPRGLTDMYTVLDFSKEYIPVVELIVDVATRSTLAKAISHVTGLTVTPEHFVTDELVRVFNPDGVKYVNEELTIHTLHSGDNVKYVLAGWSILTSAPVDDGGRDT